MAGELEKDPWFVLPARIMTPEQMQRGYAAPGVAQTQPPVHRLACCHPTHTGRATAVVVAFDYAGMWGGGGGGLQGGWLVHDVACRQAP